MTGPSYKVSVWTETSGLKKRSMMPHTLPAQRATGVEPDSHSRAPEDAGGRRIVIWPVEGLRTPPPGSALARLGRVRQDEEDTRRLWRGLLVGTALSLSGFWGPLGLAVWWLR